MVKVNRTSGTAGAWIKKDELKSGEPLLIVSEAALVEGQNGAQLVAKVRQKGSTEVFNTAINNTSKNALIDAFGDDTKDWVNKVVTAVTERAIIAGKRSIILYLVPEGYELKEGADGFMAIERADVQVAEKTPVKRAAKVEESEEDTREVPFTDEDVNW